MTSQSQSSRDLDAVRALLRSWDPIGVLDAAAREGGDPEYDSYASGVLRLLVGGGSKRDLVAHLAQLRAGSMGVVPNVERDLLAAEELLVWWRSRTD